MKKLLLTFASVLMCLTAMAQSEVIYSLEPIEGTNNSYASSCKVDINGIIWNVEGNTKYSYDGMQLYRMGGKSLENVDRALTSLTPMVGAVDKVVLTSYRINITVNSAKLLVADNAEFTNATEVVAEEVVANGETVFNVSAPAGAYYKFVFNVTNPSTSNQYIEIQRVDFYGTKPADVIDAPVFSVEGGSFAGPQTVELSAAEGCKIYYTLDGSEPTVESTEYTAPLTITGTTTVKAIAEKNGKVSLVATEVYNILKAMTIDELHEAATDEKVDVMVNFDGWLCSAVRGKSNVYFTDGNGKGILLYSSNHGFSVGDKLTGVVASVLTLYNGAPELMDLKATDEGLTVTSGQEVPVVEMNVADLSAATQGALVVLKGVVYKDGKFYQGEDAVAPYGGFMTLPDFEEGVSYDITGVSTFYKNIQIAPRSQSDIIKSAATGISEIIGAQTSADGKFVENGRVVIVRTGKKFNVAGQSQK